MKAAQHALVLKCLALVLRNAQEITSRFIDFQLIKGVIAIPDCVKYHFGSRGVAHGFNNSPVGAKF
ncbi:MAG: hypothetical protein DRR19_02710 [Candidatus Parabeggiatoa sp. nov. 1]|nr:MAG: hypothetical protein DRR19_02710 [Gammaproteobacteria bacterium]